LPARRAPGDISGQTDRPTALDEVADAWEQASGHTAVVALAGSSELARQIAHGAPADVFISANTAWMDAIQADDLVEPGTRIDLLGNRLVLIAHGHDAPPVEIGPDLDLAGLLGEGPLAMALVDAVPAGIYGKAALDSLGLWEGITLQVAQADNVRAALAFVATGEAPFGIVYATDAAAENDVSVVGIFPADSHPPIVYPAAAVAGGDTALACEFLAFLQRDAARDAFARQGFDVLR
jgi:molybdate transport system substrate-binding protein